MKKLINAALAFGIVYLLGAFANASFDITEWDTGGRVIIAFLGAATAFTAFMETDNG